MSCEISAEALSEARKGIRLEGSPSEEVTKASPRTDSEAIADKARDTENKRKKAMTRFRRASPLVFQRPPELLSRDDSGLEEALAAAEGPSVSWIGFPAAFSAWTPAISRAVSTRSPVIKR